MDYQGENQGKIARSIDEQLLPYLNSEDGPDAEEHIQRLLEIARPIVYRIVRSMRAGISATQRPADLTTHDVFGEVCLSLLKNLHALKSNPQEHAISNFSGLVATTTSTVLSHHLRGKERHRKNLREKLLRLFSTSADLSTWKDSQNNVICGYAAWQPRRGSSHTAAIRQPSQLDLNFTLDQLDDVRNKNTAELTLLVLDNLGRPVKFDDLVDLVNIAAQGVQVQTISIDETHYVQASPLMTPAPDYAATIDNHRLLHRLLGEIQKLNVEQRKSLLLNMRDSFGYGIEWFLFTKIATEEVLADLLQRSVVDFRRLLADLPMSDEDIARELGTSPAKVMNMRRAVRERLNRRRRAFFSNTDSMRMK
jgi:DNA-directed RNA polymerase specialized sigma24 family protein